MTSLFIWLLRVYQVVMRPLLPRACRFLPSCSEFAIEAVREHGILRGGVLAARRVMRCHPGNPGGEDPVPRAPPTLERTKEGEKAGWTRS